jgi:Protein kinase domain
MDFLRPDDPPKIGDYVLSRWLGSGGMGEVFFGRSPGGLAVAVKLVHPVFAKDLDFRRRFRLEVEACSKVSGGRTAQVFDADPDADRPWMVTAYVQGPPLSQVLAQYRALPPDSVRVLGAGLAEALVRIHAADIVHRDLKPSNILLADDGPRVIDFGIARAIDASGVTARPGTPGFMAPEVLNKKPITQACDIFALGVVLARASGVHPFGEGPPQAIDYQVVHGEPDLEGLDPQIRGLVAECLAKDPLERPKPERLLGRLAIPDPGAAWLPEHVHNMIIACAPPRESMVLDTGPPDHSRLLAEADRDAHVLADRHERASALLHIAAAASRIDPTAVARLLDDAWYPAKLDLETDGQGHQALVQYLIESSTVDVGTMVASLDPAAADQMLADIAEYSHRLSHRNMGFEEETAKVIIAIAEAAAANPDRADRIAHLLTDESLRAKAVARVAMAVAYADPARANLLARTIVSRIEQTIRPVGEPSRESRAARGWRRPRPQPTAVPADAHFDDTARYWAVRSLAEVALGAGGASPAWTNRPSSDSWYLARTITVTDEPRQGTPGPVGKAGGGTALAASYLADAERLASRFGSGFTADGVAAADLRAGALCAIRTAEARLQPVRAVALLTEAEKAARAIAADWVRFEALEQVAFTAASTAPVRTEQIARSLDRLPHKLCDLVLLAALEDVMRAERIATTITDVYLRSLVRAVLAVKAAPEAAEERLSEAMRAAGPSPARMLEVALVIARMNPVRAEQISRTLAAGPDVIYRHSDDNQYGQLPTNGYMRSAEYWKIRALTDLAVVSYESKSHRNLTGTEP